MKTKVFNSKAMFTIFASIVCSALNVYIIFSNKAPAFTSISSILYIVSFIFSIIYVVNGAKKSEAFYFKLFVFVCSLSELFTCIAQIDTILKGDSLPIPVAVLSGAVALIYLLIALKKNLGKRFSYLLIIIAFVIRFVEFITGIFLAKDSIVPYNIVIFRNISSLIIALILGTCIYSKYQDKMLRNTK